MPPVGTVGGMQKGLKKYFVNMDEYLTSLGFYRKMVARDASSLFRAVSEQVSGTKVPTQLDFGEEKGVLELSVTS